MNFFEIVLTLAISLGAVVWGVNIYNQKGTWFLAGWNTMSKEEKATYNEKAICHESNMSFVWKMRCFLRNRNISFIMRQLQSQ